MKKTKGELICGTGTITHTGSVSIGGLGETPVIYITLDNGRKLRWTSNKAADWMYRVGESVHVYGYWYEATNGLRRVILTSSKDI